jgi:hypothetical protein
VVAASAAASHSCKGAAKQRGKRHKQLQGQGLLLLRFMSSSSSEMCSSGSSGGEAVNESVYLIAELTMWRRL